MTDILSKETSNVFLAKEENLLVWNTKKMVGDKPSSPIGKHEKIN